MALLITGLHVVTSGLVEVGDLVASGGIAFASGGVLSNTTVDSGGFELVASQEFPNPVPLGGFSETLGIAIGTIVNAGGVDLVFSNGVVSNTFVSTGGLEVLEGPATGFTKVGSSFDTTVDGGLQIVFGFANGTTVNSGTEIVWAGGFSESSTLNGRSSFEFVLGAWQTNPVCRPLCLDFTAPGVLM